MYWWLAGDRDGIRRDFDLLAAFGFRSLSLPLPWIDFQQRADAVAGGPMRRLETVLEELEASDLRVTLGLLPALAGLLLTLPHWALDPWTMGEREVYTGLGFSRSAPRDLYGDEAMLAAQSLLVREVVGEFDGHPAVDGWVLAHGFGAASTPRGDDQYARWVDRLTAEAERRGSAPRLQIALSARDLIAECAVDPVAITAAGARVLLSPMSQPAWARGSGAAWDSFLAAYASALAGSPVSTSLAAASTADVTLQREIVEQVAAVGGTGVYGPDAFEPAPDVARTRPYRSGAAHTGQALFSATGAAGDAAALWRDLQRDSPSRGQPPPDFPMPDPERRRTAPVSVARESFDAFLR